jgi:hypothetical protein
MDRIMWKTRTLKIRKLKKINNKKEIKINQIWMVKKNLKKIKNNNKI